MKASKSVTAMISGSIEDFVKRQTDSLCDMWNDCNGENICLPMAVSEAEKSRNEACLSNLLGWMGSQLERSNIAQNDRTAFSKEMRERTMEAGRLILNFTDEQMDCLEELGITRSAGAFYHQAREFDPFISFESIFQASRNVWTSNYLQVLLGLPVALTPSIFAYSMLYPVSDNYLDDPGRSKAEKYEFNKRFTAWLNGDCVVPHCWDEEDVQHLVRMIETQYPRERFPQVYDSLLAIHRAQIKSLQMAKPDRAVSCSEAAVMTFEKGGTSVLADGMLAAGELSEQEMEIIFNYGAFAQLMDDQEDVLSDLKEGNVTLFSQAAREGKTEQIMNRVFIFANRVLKGLQKFNPPQALPLKQMSMKGIDLLLIDGILRTEKCYPRWYLNRMEKHFPFRFEYVKKVRKGIRKKGFATERLIGLLVGKEPQSHPVTRRAEQYLAALSAMSVTR